MIISGKMQLDQKIVNLNSVTLDARESVILAAKAKDIEILTKFAEEEPLILGDAIRVQQIVWNLLSNAIKFTPKGGEIHLSVHAMDSRYRIEVKDSGQGIDPAFLPFVFDRFRQEDSSTSRRTGGLGLGLGIARHLTELHGGTIQVHSEGKGKGATFAVELPMAPLKQMTNKPADQKETPTKEKLFGIKILIVEDQKDVRDLLVQFLKSHRMIVEEARSAVEALSKLATFNPQVMVCDIGLPETDGFTLIRMIRDQELNFGGFVPAIALTAFAQEGVREKVFASGFQSYLSKPADGSALLAEITRVLKG